MLETSKGGIQFAHLICCLTPSCSLVSLSMTPSLTDDRRDLLALHLVPGIGPRLTAALLERFGSAAAVRRASADDLREIPYLGENLADKLASTLSVIDVDA